MEKDFQDVLFKLLQTSSYTGKEGNVVQVILGLMEELGYDEFFVDEVGNCIGILKGTKEGANKTLLFDGHIDTVEADNVEEWTVTNPFTPLIKDGKLYGRGASDMKGAFGSMLYGLSLVDKKSFSGRIVVSGTVNEETAEGYSIQPVLERIKPDIVIIGEATNLALNIGQRGRAEIVLRTLGRSAHSANPAVGINAVLKMNKALTALEENYVIREDVLGQGILVLTDIISTPYPGESVIPRVCEATFDRRLLLGENRESVLKGLTEVLEPLKKADQDFSYEVFYRENAFKSYHGYEMKGDKFYLPWKMEETSEEVLKAGAALEKAGFKNNLSSYSFCTNGSSSCGLLGIPTLGYGPGRETEAHITNEYISVSDLEIAKKAYGVLALGLLE